MFESNDSYCPPKTFAVYTDDQASVPSADDLLNYNVTDATLNLFAQTEKQHDFHVYAMSITQKTASKPASVVV
jgi:hypothetical protein